VIVIEGGPIVTSSGGVSAPTVTATGELSSGSIVIEIGGVVLMGALGI
jgi:hypothetical protein